jgi:beta-lactamase regulating signal transducer with metallopeptidase domain
MFFNPIVLLEFRRAIQDEEKICDDRAISLTSNPHALAETLKKIYREPGDGDLSQSRQLSRLRDSLEEHSHNIHLESRVKRLETRQPQTGERGLIPFTMALAAVAIINYFVV